MVVAHRAMSRARSAALMGLYGGPVYSRSAATSARVSLAAIALGCELKSPNIMPAYSWSRLVIAFSRPIARTLLTTSAQLGSFLSAGTAMAACLTT
jgi:hypothetical protein